MSHIHRVTTPGEGSGDVNTKNGVATTPRQTTVFVNRKYVSVDGVGVSPDSDCDDNNSHCTPHTANGGPTVFAGNRPGVDTDQWPVNNEGDRDTCGHARKELIDDEWPDVFSDAFQGGGAMFDNNPPYGDDPPIGAQPSPPAGYENNTTATIYVFESNDTEDDVGNGPPSGVNYTPLTEQEAQPEQVAQNVPPVIACPTINALPATFNWSTEIGATTFEDWATTFQLSPNFSVWSLCSCAAGHHEFNTNMVQNGGLTQKAILANMCHHANTVLEPLLAAYGPFVVTSGFRNNSDASQHNRGQATDIQYPSLHTTSRTYMAKMGVRQDYYNLAQNIRDNINFDQLILEYFGINPWFHISSNPANHRGNVLTQISSAPNYASGLRLLG